MKHYTREQIENFVAGGFNAFEQKAIKHHIQECQQCHAMYKKELSFALRVRENLDKSVSCVAPSHLLDARIRREIDLICAQKARRAYLPRWAVAMSFVTSFLIVVYGFFFYAPIVGASHETPAQAMVSSMFDPLFKKAVSLIPSNIDSMSTTYEKLAFLNVLCDRYGVCDSERAKLIIQQKYGYNDVFVSSLLSIALDLSSEDILPLISKGKTPGQVFSAAGVPFARQVFSADELENQIVTTQAEIKSRNSLGLDVIKTSDGKIIAPEGVVIPADKIPGEAGQYRVVIDRKSDSVLSSKQVNPLVSVVGEIKELALQNGEIIVVNNFGKTSKVALGFETRIFRYNEPILSVQLNIGQQIVVQGIPNGQNVVATFIDVEEKNREVRFIGNVADLGKDDKGRSFISIGGFGSSLYINSTTKIAGKIISGSYVEFEASGNDIIGYIATKITLIPPKEKPQVNEELVKLSGLVVNVTTDEGSRKLFLLNEGTMVYYTSQTKFTGKLAEGMFVELSGVVAKVFDDKGALIPTKHIDAKTVTIKDPGKPSQFAIAGEMTTIRCLSTCSWVKSEGLTEITVKGQSVSFLIHPDTLGHKLVTPQRVGQMVIIEGRNVGGIMLVDKAQTTDPTKQIVRGGIIASISGNVITLDDGKTAHLAPYTVKDGVVQVGTEVVLTCMESDGKLIILKLESVTSELATTKWLQVTSFEDNELILEDGTRIQVTSDTRILFGVAKLKGNPSMLKAGVVVACTYKKLATNIATEILIQTQ
jgi:hypothetical protein